MKCDFPPIQSYRAMAHKPSCSGKGGQQRRQYFSFHFVRKASSWKKVLLKCLHPPSCSLFNSTNKSQQSVFLAIFFPSENPMHSSQCIVIHLVCSKSMCGLCRVCSTLGMAACLHALTENMAPSLCVNAQPLHCME